MAPKRRQASQTVSKSKRTWESSQVSPYAPHIIPVLLVMEECCGNVWGLVHPLVLHTLRIRCLVVLEWGKLLILSCDSYQIQVLPGCF